jgi:hypothetical protein
MTHATVRRLSLPAVEPTDHPSLDMAGTATLRLAPRALEAGAPLPPAARVSATLRNPHLVADLRQARAIRFASRYEWLALRRRRAQIAARHALGN